MYIKRINISSLAYFMLAILVIYGSDAAEQTRKETELKPSYWKNPSSTHSTSTGSSIKDDIYIDDGILEGSGNRGEIHDDLEKEADYSGSGYGPDDEDSVHTISKNRYNPSILKPDRTRVTEENIGGTSGDGPIYGRGDNDDEDYEDEDEDGDDDDDDDDEDGVVPSPIDRDEIGKDGGFIDTNNNNEFNFGTVDGDDDNENTGIDHDNNESVLTHHMLDINKPPPHHSVVPVGTIEHEEEHVKKVIHTEDGQSREHVPDDNKDHINKNTGSSGIDSGVIDLDVDPSKTLDVDGGHIDKTPDYTKTFGSGEVSIMNTKNEDRTTSFFAQPGILAAVIGGAVVGLLCAILVVMFIVYRMRKKDEGSYALDEPKRSPAATSYAKNANNREFYA